MLDALYLAPAFLSTRDSAHTWENGWFEAEGSWLGRLALGMGTHDCRGEVTPSKGPMMMPWLVLSAVKTWIMLKVSQSSYDVPVGT